MRGAQIRKLLRMRRIDPSQRFQVPQHSLTPRANRTC
jgi:hypothetical protein